MSNFLRLMEMFKENFPEEYKPKVDIVSQIVKKYVKKNDIKIKFLNSCSAGFAGVKTKDFIIICSPMNMQTIGDFLYTIFHEIRHDSQIRKIKMKNPLVDFDLDDFEKLYEQYWDMELDADTFAKNMVAKIVIQLEIPISIAKQQFKLSPYIEQYPSMSKGIENYLRNVVREIKIMKSKGMEYTDISDHPLVKKHLQNLENFI